MPKWFPKAAGCLVGVESQQAAGSRLFSHGTYLESSNGI